MNAPTQDAVQAHLKLQDEFMAYIEKNGFDYGAYCAPPPGSFYEDYRKRWLELTHQLAPALQYGSKKK